MIENNKVKNFLYNARNHCIKGDFKGAIEQIAISFKVMIGDYKSDEKRFGVHSFLSKMFFQDKELEDVQQLLKLIFLNVDSRKYLKFNFLTPFVTENEMVSWYRPNQNLITKEQVDFCFNFVIETALNLQEFDSDIQDL